MKSALLNLVLAAGLVTSINAADKITYEDHVLPVLRNACLKCHNPDKAKADLDLSTYKASLKGSGSGKVLLSGDADGSKLFKAVTHAEEPTMPPNGKLADKEIELFKQWIVGGLLENAGAKAVASNKPAVDLAAVAPTIGKPEGPPPMPGEMLLDPVTHTDRSSVSTALAASPWAPLVALGGQRQVLLYNTDTLELAGVLPFPEGAPCDLKFSRNGKLLLCGGGRASKSGLVAVWDVTKAERVLAVGDEFDSVLAADISADQKWIALGGPSRIVKIFSTKDGQAVHKMKKHTDWVTAAEFSPDSKLLATGDRNGGLVVWEADSGEEVYTLAGHKAAVTRVAWCSPNLLVSASEDGTVKLWTMDEGQQAKSWSAHASGTLSLASAHDGRIVTCGRDKQVVVWNANGAKQRAISFTNDIPVRVTFTHDAERIIADDWKGNVWVWKTTDGVKTGELSLNPPSLAEQKQMAAKRLEEMSKNSSPDAAKQIEVERARLERLKIAEAFAAVHRSRESLSLKETAQERLLAETAAAEEAAKHAGSELAANKKVSTKSRKEREELAKKNKALIATVRSETAKASSARKAAAKLAQDLVAEKQRLDKLTAAYQGLKAGGRST